MRSKYLVLLVLSVFATFVHAQAPRAGGPPQMRLGKDIEKLFGKNKAFTANMQMEAKMGSGTMTMPAKIAFLEGKTRFEMDASKMKGGDMPPQAAAQLQQMGMGEMVTISLPEKGESYLIYPGLKSYAVMPTPKPDDASAAAASEDPDLKKTELGKETIDGRATTKYKVTLQNDEGKEQEATVWFAPDLNNFPVKMQMTNSGIPSTVTFSDVKFQKPDEDLFAPPAAFERYADVQTMMRESMIKRFAPPGGLPTQPQPQP